jgi:hypothetical protein
MPKNSKNSRKGNSFELLDESYSIAQRLIGYLQR